MTVASLPSQHNHQFCTCFLKVSRQQKQYSKTESPQLNWVCLGVIKKYPVRCPLETIRSDFPPRKSVLRGRNFIPKQFHVVIGSSCCRFSQQKKECYGPWGQNQKKRKKTDKPTSPQLAFLTSRWRPPMHMGSQRTLVMWLPNMHEQHSIRGNGPSGRLNKVTVQVLGGYARVVPHHRNGLQKRLSPLLQMISMASQRPQLLSICIEGKAQSSAGSN